MSRAALLSLVALALAACASPTPYQPRPEPGGYGFDEQRIEENRFRVSFAGNAATPREAAENYLLYRAAELTLMNGGDYFIVTSRRTAPDYAAPGNSTRVGVGVGSSGVSFGTGVSIGVGGPAHSRGPVETSAEFVVYDGRKPAGVKDAFDAREVMRNLAAVVGRGSG